MRSRAGGGPPPPDAPGALKRTSSVIMSSTLGAPLGGTTRGAHQGVDSEALSLITPPKFGSGGGSCLPSIVLVAPGEPRTPFTCGALPWDELDTMATLDSAAAKNRRTTRMHRSFFRR